MPLLIAVGIVVVVVILANWLQDQRKRRRTAAMQAAAERLGFTFEAEGAPDELVRMGDLLLFQQGQPSSTLKNVMRGIRNGVNVAVYDYVFNVPMKRYFEVWRQTVVHIRAGGPVLPPLTLCPKDVMDAVMLNIASRERRDALLETAGVRLEAHPDFAQRYKLMAGDWEAMERLFDDRVVEVLQSGEMCVEVSGAFFFYYRMHEQRAPEEIEALVDEAVALYGLLSEKS